MISNQFMNSGKKITTSEWDKCVTRMDAERSIKVSRDNILAVERSPGHPDRRWSDLIPG